MSQQHIETALVLNDIQNHIDEAKRLNLLARSQPVKERYDYAIRQAKKLILSLDPDRGDP